MCTYCTSVVRCCSSPARHIITLLSRSQSVKLAAMKFFLLGFVALLLSNTVVFADDSFTEEDCILWAEDGECEENPGWMWKNCEAACTEHQDGSSGEVGVSSFYDLKAYDIDGDEVDFRQFEGKVVVITNVASYCGRTTQHYTELVKLHRDLKEQADGKVEIMAFPCNQFGQQEPEENPFIKDFAREKGVEFRMMDKIDVNGEDTHLVYRYLKNASGSKGNIQWNFDTYFLVDKKGHVESYTGLTPKSLLEPINGMLGGEEL